MRSVCECAEDGSRNEQTSMQERRDSGVCVYGGGTRVYDDAMLEPRTKNQETTDAGTRRRLTENCQTTKQSENGEARKGPGR